MKPSALKFWKDTAFTTALSFLLITFLFIGTFAWIDVSKAMFERFVFFRYILGKLLCIFLFSLSLGFANRLFMIKKPRVLLRLIHFFVTMISFSLTMILLFYTIFEGMDNLSVQNALFNLCLFGVFYFAVLGICSLGRRIFCPKEEKTFKSIFD